MNKIVTILVAVLFFVVTATYAQPSFTLSPTTITGNQGETVTVSLTVDNFTDLLSMQYGIKYDPAVIQYNSVENLNLEHLNAGSFSHDAQAGFLAIAWWDNNGVGVTTVDGTVIFTISFTVLGDENTGSAIAFEGRAGFEIEVASNTGVISNDQVTFTNSQFGDPNANGGGGNTTPLVSSISSGSGNNGTTVCLDVNVSNFTDITEMNYSLNWDATVLQYKEVQSLNLSGLSQASFGTTNTGSGQLSINWSDGTGVTANNGRIYQVCFDLIGDAGSSSIVSFSDTPTPISVTTTASTTSVGINQSNGAIGINTTTNPPTNNGTNLINISSVSANSGETVCVPVTVNNFDGLAGLQFSINWDPSLLQFTEIANLNLADLNAGSFNTTNAASGRLSMVWTESTTNGISVPDGTAIFEICFTAGSSGNGTISISDTPTAREAVTSNGEVSFTQTDGIVTVGSGGTNPPPTGGGDQLINIGNITGENGTEVCVPVTVNDFNNLAGMQFSVNWNPAVLQFTEIKNLNLVDLNAGSFNTTAAATGQLSMVWTESTTQGTSVPDGTVIYEICFTVVGAEGVVGGISISDTPTAREAVTSDSEVTFTQSNGSVTVGSDTNPPPPPPPGGGDQLVNVGNVTAENGATVCVPVTVNDFNNLAGMQFSVNWDPAVMQFNEIANINLVDLNAGSFNVTNAASGQLSMVWTESTTQGTSVADGTAIFEMCYTVLGANGTNTTISISDNPTAREAVTSSAEVTFTQSNGLITIEAEDTPPPPPLDNLVTIGTVTAAPDSTVCVPVSVNGFNDLAGMQFSVNWDPTILQFIEISNINLADLNAGSFNVTNAVSGQLSMVWTESTTNGISVPNGTTIYEICFKVLGADGATGTVSVTDTPTAREAVTSSAEVSFTSSDGVVNIEGDEPPPPPPPAGDQLINIANVSADMGTTTCVPVTVNDFNNLAGMQFSVNWDPAILQFTEIANLNLKDLNAGSFNVTNATNGQLSVVWTESTTQGTSVPDGTAIFEICFTLQGANGTVGAIEITDTPTAREAVTSSEEVPFTQTNGSITIGGDPNPCLAINASAIPSNVSCNGEADGSITLTVSGGDGNYTYQWSDASIGNTPNATGLAAGVYMVTISSCGGQGTFSSIPAASLTITEPTAIEAVTTPQDATCADDANGRINVSVSGGTRPYTYTWSDESLAPANRPVNVAAGTYSLTITDASGCTSETTGIVVSAPTALTATVGTSPASCSGVADGTASVSASGGTEPYAYDWGVAGIEGPSPTNLPSGVYSLTVSDANNCTQVIPVPITASVTLTNTVQVIEDACGDGKGGIQITPAGGTEPYMYAWEGPTVIGNTNAAEDLATGTYTVTITDANGCSLVESIEVGGPTAVLTASGEVIDVDCAGDATGAIDLTPSGGFGPYTFSWSNGATTEDISNLMDGEYIVTVTDSKVCTYAQAFIVRTSSNMVVSVAVTKGAPNGEATTTVSGGVEPYTYEWCNGQDSPNAIGLDEGNCSLTVIDALGCAVVTNFEIELEATSPVVVIEVAGGISCIGTSDGVITATITEGGTAPFSYAWSTGATTSVLTNVGAGTYSVTVTDGNGFTGMASLDLAEPAPLSLTGDITNSTGDDGKICINISGGTTPYKEIKWSNDIVDALCIENLPPDDYGVIITDQNDCTIEESFRVIRVRPPGDDCFNSNKAMTPNEDGRNDAFVIACVGTAANNRVEVYNRWGQLVFEADNYQCEFGTESDCWKGLTRNSNGVVDDGGYFWVLEYDDSNGRQRIRDYITIVGNN